MTTITFSPSRYITPCGGSETGLRVSVESLCGHIQAKERHRFNKIVCINPRLRSTRAENGASLSTPAEQVFGLNLTRQ